MSQHDLFVLKEIVHRFGDKNAFEYGGGIVEKEEDGSLHVEYTPGIESNLGEDGVPCCVVYREEIPDDVAAEYSWADLDSVDDSIGYDPDQDENSPFESRGRTLTELGASKDFKERLFVLEAIAGHYGWHEFDSYPIELTELQLDTRWQVEAVPPVRLYVEGMEPDQIHAVAGKWTELHEPWHPELPLGILEFDSALYVNGSKLCLYAIKVRDDPERPYPSMVGVTCRAQAMLEAVQTLRLVEYRPETIQIGDATCVLYAVPKGG